MDFSLTEDQRAFQATARQFARDAMMPQAARWDEDEVFPVETLREAASLGFGGIYVKDDVGGSELTRLDATIIFEELAQDFVDLWDARLGALREKSLSITGPSQVNHLGPGEEFEMHTAATPGSQYLPYSKDLKREMARRIGVTVESFTGDHTGATYSSVRMGNASIWPIVLRRRERIAAPFAQAIYEAWLEESIREGRIPFRGGVAAFVANRDRVVWAEWQGPAQPSADDAKSAQASRLRLELGLSSLADEAALLGRDWEETAMQIGREVKLLTELGIPTPFGRSTGGAGPNGMAADDNREPSGGTEDG